jgi:hypothetical protein
MCRLFLQCTNRYHGLCICQVCGVFIGGFGSELAAARSLRRRAAELGREAQVGRLNPRPVSAGCSGQEISARMECGQCCWVAYFLFISCLHSSHHFLLALSLCVRFILSNHSSFVLSIIASPHLIFDHMRAYPALPNY